MMRGCTAFILYDFSNSEAALLVVIKSFVEVMLTSQTSVIRRFRKPVRIMRMVAQSRPCSPQHSLQYPTFRAVSVEQPRFSRGELFHAMLASRRVEKGSVLMTLIVVLQSLLSGFIRQRRVDFCLQVSHGVDVMSRPQSMACRGGFRIRLLPLAAERSDADSGRPCRTVSSKRRSGIRMRLGRFACRVSA